jgi:hypothetical protein
MSKALDILKAEAAEMEKGLRGIYRAIKALGGTAKRAAAKAAKPPKKKRRLSAASRKALSNAAKKRWANAKAKSAT